MYISCIRSSQGKAGSEAVGKAEVVGAAPVNLFGKAVFYMVGVKARGEEHLLGVALKEAPDAPEETVYCYLFVNNEKFGELGEKDPDPWRDLVGIEDTCFKSAQDSTVPGPQKPKPQKSALDLHWFRRLFQTENSARKGEHCHQQIQPTHRSFAEKLSGWLEPPMRNIPSPVSPGRSES